MNRLERDQWEAVRDDLYGELFAGRDEPGQLSGLVLELARSANIPRWAIVAAIALSEGDAVTEIDQRPEALAQRARIIWTKASLWAES